MLRPRRPAGISKIAPQTGTGQPTLSIFREGSAAPPPGSSINSGPRAHILVELVGLRLHLRVGVLLHLGDLPEIRHGVAVLAAISVLLRLDEDRGRRHLELGGLVLPERPQASLRLVAMLVTLEGLFDNIEGGERHIIVTLGDGRFGLGETGRAEILDALERLLGIRDNRIVLGLLEILGQLLDAISETTAINVGAGLLETAAKFQGRPGPEVLDQRFNLLVLQARRMAFPDNVALGVDKPGMGNSPSLVARSTTDSNQVIDALVLDEGLDPCGWFAGNSDDGQSPGPELSVKTVQVGD